MSQHFHQIKTIEQPLDTAKVGNSLIINQSHPHHHPQRHPQPISRYNSEEELRRPHYRPLMATSDINHTPASLDAHKQTHFSTMTQPASAFKSAFKPHQTSPVSP